VCKAIDGYQAGQLSQEQALARAGWDRASAHERGLLLDMLGIGQAPQDTPAQPGGGLRPDVPAPRPSPVGGEVRVPEPRPAPAARHITPEVVALVDQLQAAWAAEPGPAPQAAAGFGEPEAGS
jgi:hypothetical protein